MQGSATYRIGLARTTGAGHPSSFVARRPSSTAYMPPRTIREDLRLSLAKRSQQVCDAVLYTARMLKSIPPERASLRGSLIQVVGLFLFCFPLDSMAAEQIPVRILAIPPGTFAMGSDQAKTFNPVRPAHTVQVTGFYLDRNEVTNAQFTEFITDTKHVTTAEKPVDWSDFKNNCRPVPLNQQMRHSPPACSPFHRQPPRSPISLTTVNGGNGCMVPFGDIQLGQQAISRDWPITPLSRYHGTMPLLMARG